MSNSEFTLGADPEFLLEDMDGVLKSAEGKIGTEDLPRIGTYCSMFEDNILAEVNTKVASNSEEFLRYSSEALREISNIAEERNLYISRRSYGQFEDSELNTIQSEKAGCEPDYDVYKMAENEVPSFEKGFPYRSAAGHLHIGFDIKKYNIPEIVKSLDISIGLNSVLVDNGNKRRQLYGKAGCHRPQITSEDLYTGVEYRVLSNYWMFYSEYQRSIYNGISIAFSEIKDLVHFSRIYESDIQQSINEGDCDKAANLLEVLNG